MHRWSAAKADSCQPHQSSAVCSTPAGIPAISWAGARSPGCITSGRGWLTHIAGNPRSHEQLKCSAGQPDQHLPLLLQRCKQNHLVHPDCPLWLDGAIQKLQQKYRVPCTPVAHVHVAPHPTDCHALLGRRVAFALLEDYVHRAGGGRQFILQPGLHVGR